MNLKDALIDLQKQMLKKGWEVLLIEDPIDLFYLTGLKFSCGQLFVYPQGAHLFVDGRYLESGAKQANFPVSLMSEENTKAFLKERSCKEIICDGRKMSHDRFLELEKKWGYPLSSESGFFKTLRGVKSKKEIQKLQKSADLLYQGFLYLKKQLKVGVQERDLASLFEIFCLKQGAEGLSFPPIIAFGPHSAMPHYRAGQGILRKADVVLMDLGVLLEGYHSDMTRVVFFGKKDPFLKRIQEIVREAKLAALQIAKPGTRIGALDEAAISVFDSYGVSQNYLHSLGHGVGLEIHEFPRVSFKGEDKETLLEEGMVITIEPGLYFSGKGGVRDEDTIVITKTGYHNFYGQHDVLE